MTLQLNQVSQYDLAHEVQENGLKAKQLSVELPTRAVSRIAFRVRAAGNLHREPELPRETMQRADWRRRYWHEL